MFEETTATAAELMTHDVAVVHPETSLLEAVRVMAQRNISGLPVLDAQGGITGILTEGDLMRWHQGYSEKQARWLDMLAEGGNLAPSFLASLRDQQNKVAVVMSKNVITVNEATPAREVASLMTRHGIKRIPVLRAGKLVGIIARSDLIRALAAGINPPAAPETEGGLSVNEALRRRREETDPHKAQ